MILHPHWQLHAYVPNVPPYRRAFVVPRGAPGNGNPLSLLWSKNYLYPFLFRIRYKSPSQSTIVTHIKRSRSTQPCALTSSNQSRTVTETWPLTLCLVTAAAPPNLAWIHSSLKRRATRVTASTWLEVPTLAVPRPCRAQIVNQTRQRPQPLW